MATRVLHLSDLHFGRNDKPESIEALGRLVEEARPELVIASGDLTHRGLRTQHEKAAAFLRGLDLPLLTIPGNHDIPYTFPKRFTSPWREFERLWETTEPVYRSEALVVVGLNSVRPVAPPVGPASRRPAESDGRGLRRSAGGRVPHRHLPSPPARRPLALAQEAGRQAQPRPRRARRGRRRPRARRAHPPEHGRGAARVRALEPGGRARRGRLDRARVRPAEAEPPRRGPRPPRLRDRATRRCASSPTSGARTAGG